MLHANPLAEVLGEESRPRRELPGLESKPQRCKGLPVPGTLVVPPQPASLVYPSPACRTEHRGPGPCSRAGGATVIHKTIISCRNEDVE